MATTTLTTMDAPTDRYTVRWCPTPEGWRVWDQVRATWATATPVAQWHVALLLAQDLQRKSVRM